MKSRLFRASARAQARPYKPLASWRAFALAACSAMSIAGGAYAQEAPLTLAEALRLAEAHDPRLRAAEAGLDGADGDLRQARARLNPVLDVEVENFGGEDSLRGFDGSESTFRLSQQVELGDRRRARIDVAEQGRTAAAAEALIARLDVLEEVQRAYYDALAADALVHIAVERVETAEALQASVERRVAAARDPLMAGARAEAGLAEARIALDGAQREAATARATLASLTGVDAGFILAAADLGVPDVRGHDHQSDLDASPDLARVSAARDRARAELRLQRSRGWQDPTLSLGVRRFEETGETGLVAGVSIPLGAFDRNRGAIARADADARRAGYDVEAERRRIERDGAALQRRLDGAASTVAAIERFVIPQAERALELARDGYNQGAFSYLDVLEAQRALTAAREARIEALRNYHHTEAALDRLTARFADAFGVEISQ